MIYRSKRFITIFFIFCLPASGFTQETVQIIVLPFEIHAKDNLSYLQHEIPRLIKNQLKQEGAVVQEPPIADDVYWRRKIEGVEDIRRLGISHGSDYVLWGSLTRVGQKFSLDARLLKSFADSGPDVFFLEGEGIETLISVVKRLARNVGMKLFKRQRIAKIVIAGNRRIEADAIMRRIKTEPGEILVPKKLSDDLKSIYSMGYFDDIRIEAQDSPEGKIIIFRVKEKQTVRRIRFKGNKKFDDEDLLEALTIKTGSILNIFQIQRNIQRIEEMYREKNYHNVKISYDIKELDNNQADIRFTIQEGEKVQIKRISFVGNRAFSDKKLKGIMKTSEKGFFSWLTSSGDLNKEDLKQDIAKLTAFYQNKGYIQAKIGEPQIKYEGNWIFITIKIDEGPRFRVRKVDITGDLVRDKAELISNLKIIKEDYFNREILRRDVLTLTDIYSDEGFAYAEITPQVNRDFENLAVDIIFVAKKGKPVYFEKIIITGNTKTRDKVIRRQLKVYEQELFSGKRLKQGIRNLYRLDYFEEIKVDTLKGSAEDKMILKIDVKEKPTGAFSVGGGYSSVEDLFFVASISQRNLFGRGQILNVRGEISGRTTRFIIRFTEPWLFDIPLSAGVDVYNWSRDWDLYVKDSIGGAVRLGYPLFNYTRGFLTYNFDRADIRDITDDAPVSIKELVGINITSSITGRMRYDSRDKIFLPTQGSDHSAAIEYAGLGGDVGFVKLTGNTGWYIPLFLGTTGFVHGAGGWVQESTGKVLPDYEKFFLGGINTVRGYDWRDIALKDPDGAKIGGEKFVQFNLEYIFPIYKKAGLMGLVFSDAGNVYASDEDVDLGDLFYGVGGGIRWYSPMGPIRLEWGYPVNPDDDMRQKGRFEFSMGGAF
ncbi:MAG: outer membrane protein assembly factor BamA [Deltaproteobacteria bacterium]|nr:outer membrane protein assembly factor BamA [Deltaproteobacteria bacterium]